MGNLAAVGVFVKTADEYSNVQRGNHGIRPLDLRQPERASGQEDEKPFRFTDPLDLGAANT